MAEGQVNTQAKTPALTVAFMEDKKVVTHPNGTVSEYPKTVLENFKQNLLQQKQRIDDQIAAIDNDLGSIETARLAVAAQKTGGV